MADKKTEQDELFPDFTFESDAEDVEEDNDEPEGKKEDDEQEDAEKVELKKKVEQQDKRFDEIMDAMLRNQQPQQQVEPQDQFREMEVPSPIDDPDGFAKAVQHNADMRVKRELANAEARQRETENSSKIWNQFQSKYPELAKHEDVVEVVSQKIAKDMQEAGIDFKRYVATDPNRFFDKVAERMNNLIASFSGGGTAADRTSGLVGQNGVKRQKKQTKQQDGDDATLIDDIKKMQLDSGLY